MALMDLLPDNYRKSPHVVGLQEAIEYFAEKLKSDKIDLFNQIGVNTATWGLDLWERSLGIKTDVSAPTEFRRERICAKLRGAGTITKAMIKQTAAAYSGGEVEIIEHPETSSFVVRFVGTVGIPDNMEDLTLTIEEIKPAHLSFTFEYIYVMHEELTVYTHKDLSPYSHAEIKEGFHLTHNYQWASEELSGTSIEIPDSIARKIKITKIEGAASQVVTVQGKNLLPNKASTTTINGITFTVNADKSVTMNGTATANANLPIYGTGWSDTASKTKLSSGSTYVLGKGSTNAIVYVRDAENNINFETPLNGTRTITGMAQITYAFIQVPIGKTCTNETIYPQLELGTVATVYEPFVPNSPSPDYPSAIVVAKDFNVVSSNGIQSDSVHVTGEIASLPNGVKNTYEYINGALYKVQRVGKVVFDGSADEAVLIRSDLEKTNSVYFQIGTISHAINNLNDYNIISNKFKATSIVGTDTEGISAYNSVICIRINKSRLATQNVADFKAWLATNPITVYYELSTPIYTPVPNLTLQGYEETTYITTTANPQVTISVLHQQEEGGI